jgi:hypothetical protein
LSDLEFELRWELVRFITDYWIKSDFDDELPALVAKWTQWLSARQGQISRPLEGWLRYVIEYWEDMYLL